MTVYIRNRGCHCARCRARGLMGPAILITIGVLFLLQEYFWIRFEETWPALLIVIGLLSFASRSGSTEGHVQPNWLERVNPPPPPPPSSQPPYDPQVRS